MAQVTEEAKRLTTGNTCPPGKQRARSVYRESIRRSNERTYRCRSSQRRGDLLCRAAGFIADELAMTKDDSRTHILLVEDDTWLAEMEQGVLQKAGYEVAIAPHALAAIELIDAHIPDIIILDVLLAGSTAFAFLNELQSHDDTKEIPIVLCTNLAEQFSDTKLAAYGVKRVVNKTTMHPSDLVAAVKAVL